MSSKITLPPFVQSFERGGRQQLPCLREVFSQASANYQLADADSRPWDGQQQRDVIGGGAPQGRDDMLTLNRPTTSSPPADCLQKLLARERMANHCLPISDVDIDFSSHRPHASNMHGVDSECAESRGCPTSRTEVQKMEGRTYTRHEHSWVDSTSGSLNHIRSQQVRQIAVHSERPSQIKRPPLQVDQPFFVSAGDSVLSHAPDARNSSPEWGLTKIGKPRKRLPQACLLVSPVSYDLSVAKYRASDGRGEKVRCTPRGESCNLRWRTTKPTKPRKRPLQAYLSEVLPLDIEPVARVARDDMGNIWRKTSASSCDGNDKYQRRRRYKQALDPILQISTTSMPDVRDHPRCAKEALRSQKSTSEAPSASIPHDLQNSSERLCHLGGPPTLDGESLRGTAVTDAGWTHMCAGADRTLRVPVACSGQRSLIWSSQRPDRPAPTQETSVTRFGQQKGHLEWNCVSDMTPRDHTSGGNTKFIPLPSDSTELLVWSQFLAFPA